MYQEDPGYQEVRALAAPCTADALHLACAAEAGFSEVHSNDRHLRAAALLFGVRAP